MKALVDVEGVRLRRPGRSGFELAGVSLNVERGSVLGLVGPNGAGKTTIIRSMLGLVPIDSGRISIFGHDPGSPSALARTGIVLDRPRMPEEWRVQTVPARLRPFYPAWSDATFTELQERLRIPPTRKVGELSKGEGVKLSLAAAFAQTPELLVLDEPSSGLDPASRREIGALIREFMADTNGAVLFSTHITDELDELADTLVVVLNGRVARSGPLRQVVEEFAVVRGRGRPQADALIGVQRSGERWTALARVVDAAQLGADVEVEDARIDDIVVHFTAEREGAHA